MYNDPLHDWQEWGIGLNQRPELLRELSRGRTNKHYLLDAEGHRVVLRRNNPASEVLGIERAREEIILRAVSDAGLFPKILSYSLKNQVLITEFIDGKFWDKSSVLQKDRRLQLVEALRNIHTIQLDLPGFNYLEHAEKYWNTLTELKYSPGKALEQRHQHYREKVATLEPTRQLCHHDPIPGNIIASSGQLYFLDWEYSGCGWPVFDFAALAQDWALDSKLLCKTANLDEAAFADAQLLYSHLCELWELVRQYQGS